MSLCSNSKIKFDGPKILQASSGPEMIFDHRQHFRSWIQAHQSLAKLSQKYGPIMSLKLGSITAIIVSSPKTAKIMLQKYYLPFSSRTIPSAIKSLNHHEFPKLWLPVEHQWRKLRKICKEQIFTASQLDASQGLRRERLKKLLHYVKHCSKMGRAVDIRETAFAMSLNLILAMLFSMEFAQFNLELSLEMMKGVVWGVMKYVGSPNFADYLVEALIEINKKDEAELSRNDIKHLLLVNSILILFIDLRNDIIWGEKVINK